jgi:hypothetical protein
MRGRGKLFSVVGMIGWLLVFTHTSLAARDGGYDIYDNVSINDGSGSGKIPDTGQTTSYTDTFGEDSDYT